jgi:hypothetical protein
LGRAAELEFTTVRDLRGKLDAFLKDVTANITTDKQDAATNAYKTGDRGPAGGWIFYDQGVSANGWRYLEAAPSETEFTAEWGAEKKDVPGTATAIGTGKRNTQLIVDYLRNSRERGRAAQLCDSLVTGSFNDWYLPSKDELNLMYMNLGWRGLGGFSGGVYWSSSQVSNDRSWLQSFNGFRDNQFPIRKNSTRSVRAVRAF